MSDIIFTPLAKALNTLGRALEQPLDEYTRDASIQRFEYSYELAWKILKRFMADIMGVREDSIKNLYRQAAKHDVIKTPENWFAFHNARNLTSHTYNEDTANEVYETAKAFHVEALELLRNMEKRVDRAG